jgi:aminopeptidase N
MGDELFHECVQTFYENFKFGNALTEDFLEVVESVTGLSYETFFRQWFYQAGHPVLSAQWKKRGKKIILTLRQHQEQHLFEFPIDIELRNDKGEAFRETLFLHSSSQSFSLKPSFKTSELILDPDTWLLFESYESP